MKAACTWTALAVAAIASLAARVGAVVVVTIDSPVSCSNLTLTINAAQREASVLPEYLLVNIQNQSMVATLPSFDTAQTLNATTVQFEQAFVLPDGNYPMILDLVTSPNTNHSIASFHFAQVPFKGCYASSTHASTSTMSTSAMASATINEGYLASAAPTSTSSQETDPPAGRPTRIVSLSPGIPLRDDDEGLSSSAKIGITVGVLFAALLATVAAMVFVLRRRNQTQQRSQRQATYAERWIADEDRNGAELKEVHSPA